MMKTVHIGAKVLFVWLYTKLDPNQREWEQAMRAIIRTMEAVEGDLSRLSLLVVTDGGAPDAKQRKYLFGELLRAQPVPLAVISNSLDDPVKRGLVTVLKWLNPAFRTFSATESPQAFDHIGYPSREDIERIWHALTQMQKELPKVITLREVAPLLGFEVPRATLFPPAR